MTVKLEKINKSDTKYICYLYQIDLILIHLVKYITWLECKGAKRSNMFCNIDMFEFLIVYYPPKLWI